MHVLSDAILPGRKIGRMCGAFVMHPNVRSIIRIEQTNARENPGIFFCLIQTKGLRSI